MSVDYCFGILVVRQLTVSFNKITLLACPLEAIDLKASPMRELLQDASAVVVLAVHSHAPLQAFWQQLLQFDVILRPVFPCLAAGSGDPKQWKQQDSDLYQRLMGE